MASCPNACAAWLHSLFMWLNLQSGRSRLSSLISVITPCQLVISGHWDRNALMSDMQSDSNCTGSLTHAVARHFLLYCTYNIVEQCFRLLPYQYCTSSAITTFQHRLLFRLVLWASGICLLPTPEKSRNYSRKPPTPDGGHTFAMQDVISVVPGAPEK
jgi:hypothetical protein